MLLIVIKAINTPIKGERMEFAVQASEITKISVHGGLPTHTPKFQPAAGPPRGDLWDSATAGEWGVAEAYGRGVLNRSRLSHCFLFLNAQERIDGTDL
jgi:hypothetical protein